MSNERAATHAPKTELPTLTERDRDGELVNTLIVAVRNEERTGLTPAKEIVESARAALLSRLETLSNERFTPVEQAIIDFGAKRYALGYVQHPKARYSAEDKAKAEEDALRSFATLKALTTPAAPTPHSDSLPPRCPACGSTNTEPMPEGSRYTTQCLNTNCLNDFTPAAHSDSLDLDGLLAEVLDELERRKGMGLNLRSILERIPALLSRLERLEQEVVSIQQYHDEELVPRLQKAESENARMAEVLKAAGPVAYRLRNKRDDGVAIYQTDHDFINAFLAYRAASPDANPEKKQ